MAAARFDLNLSKLNVLGLVIDIAASPSFDASCRVVSLSLAILVFIGSFMAHFLSDYGSG
jgi:hypothetical protein